MNIDVNPLFLQKKGNIYFMVNKKKSICFLRQKQETKKEVRW